MPRQKKRRIEYMPIDQLGGSPINPKGHDLAGISRSMEAHGFMETITLDERTGLIVSGHGRRDTLRQMAAGGMAPPEGIVVVDGVWTVPVVRGWSSDNDQQRDAALVAVNRLVEVGGWDDSELAQLLDGLRNDAPELLATTGFSNDDLDSLLASLQPDEPPLPDPGDDDDLEGLPPVTVAGDVWVFPSGHRVMCGDCRNPDHVAQLLAGQVIQLAFTSPPYADRRDYDEASGFVPIPPDQYVGWFEPIAAVVAEHLADDGSWCVNIKAGADGLDRDLYVMDLVVAHVREWGWHWADEFSWERNGVPKAPIMRLKNQFELVYQFARDRWKFRPDNVRHPSEDAIVPLGPGAGNTAWDGRGDGPGQGSGGNMFAGRVRPNKNPQVKGVSNADSQGTGWDAGQARGDGWAYPGNRLPTFIQTHEATGHGAAFPVGLPRFFVRLMTDEGEAVFDPFLGSGSTVLAAMAEARVGFGMELSPGYVDTSVRRIMRHHPDEIPVRESDGSSFPEDPKGD